MARSNIAFQLEEMEPFPAATTKVRKILNGEDGVLLCFAATTPTDGTGAPGYAPGCLWLNTAGADVSKWYCNIGTKASPNWNLVTVAAD